MVDAEQDLDITCHEEPRLLHRWHWRDQCFEEDVLLCQFPPSPTMRLLDPRSCEPPHQNSCLLVLQQGLPLMSVLSFCDMNYDEGKFMEAADHEVFLRHLCVYLPRARFQPLFV